MSLLLENDRWSSGSVDYSFSINWAGSKWITTVHFMLARSASETLSSTIFEVRLPPYFLTIVSQFITILTKTTLVFKFLWLEFQFKSFLELHVHFKGFMCKHMRKRHAECQISADAHDWCQSVLSFNVPKFIPKYWTTKNITIFGVIGYNFDPVYIGVGQGNSTLRPEKFHQELDSASFLTNYSGPLVKYPCPTPIHMKDTLKA